LGAAGVTVIVCKPPPIIIVDMAFEDDDVDGRERISPPTVIRGLLDKIFDLREVVPLKLTRIPVELVAEVVGTVTLDNVELLKEFEVVETAVLDSELMDGEEHETVGCSGSVEDIADD